MKGYLSDICIFASPSTRARTGRSMSVVVLSDMYRDFEVGDILSTRKQRGIIQSPDLFGIRYQNQCNPCREDSQQPRYSRRLFDSFMYDLQRLLLSAKKRLFFFAIPSVVGTEGKWLIVCSYLKHLLNMLHMHMHISTCVVFHRFTCTYTQVFTCQHTLMQRCHCYGETKACIQEEHTHASVPWYNSRLGWVRLT